MLAQCPTDGPAPTAPSAVTIPFLAEDGMAAGYVVADAGLDDPEYSVRSHSGHWKGTRPTGSWSMHYRPSRHDRGPAPVDLHTRRWVTRPGSFSQTDEEPPLDIGTTGMAS